MLLVPRIKENPSMCKFEPMRRTELLTKVCIDKHSQRISKQAVRKLDNGEARFN